MRGAAQGGGQQGGIAHAHALPVIMLNAIESALLSVIALYGCTRVEATIGAKFSIYACHHGAKHISGDSVREG